MSVHNGHDTGVINWYNAGLRVISKRRDYQLQEAVKLYTSVKVGHSGTSNLFIQVWYGHMNKQAKAKTTFDDS